MQPTPCHTPTITLVEHGAVWAIILSHPTPPPNVPVQPIQPIQPIQLDCIYEFSVSFETALSTAHSYLLLTHNDPPLPTHDPLIVFRPPSSFNPNSSYRYLYRASYSSRSPQMMVRFSDRTWRFIQEQTIYYGYDGHSSTTGCTHYLEALVKANPNLPTPNDPSSDWLDTRPHALQDADRYRTSHGLFPQWSPSYVNYGLERPKRSVNRTHFANTIVPLYMPIANHFLIASMRGNQLSPNGRVAATIEAIGHGYLTPRNPPEPNPRPVNPTRRRLGTYKPKGEIAF